MKLIYCKDCRLYLGEIRDATLRKGISYRCEKCERNTEPDYRSATKSPPPPDFITDLFKNGGFSNAFC